MQSFNVWTDPGKIRWLSGMGWDLGAKDVADRFDRPLSALITAVRGSCDAGQLPDLPAIRRRLAMIEAALADQIGALEADFHKLAQRQSHPVSPELRRRAHAALELVQGKAQATQEWLLVMARQPPPAKLPVQRRAA